ncbi:uncharacterized protein Z520_00255 [Fonsecaea multimorphosa CBS 102226]|uniref:Alpha/beta hydrolase fold-3 domain-containing protein n=1 Tax=Fonsecaea multimorphosa CBS 102226 TaxID=1442371 RepID=A0A0D2L3D0_9EURO|nr:uncharacterized protein Z520_00255 [Fonsecaea multimorphosa CBS 102226]KIY03564.1 hypothetical protein Z520_00255 [Fonsecaea multimorphosa CBS 102226]OAL32266.1 hypothetical protein AYO22_00288 [Fonsecaea multimorphosa]
MDSPKYSSFTILETTYKVVSNHAINVYTLIPKTVLSSTSPSPSPRPIIVKFHGGFLITGTALYADWFSDWLVEYALLHSAVVVCPNYRLAPEATGSEIMQDLRDFWTWLATSFPAYLAAASPGVEVDLGRVLSTGESAGGYLSVQSALDAASPSASPSPGMMKIRAAIALYPVLDLKARFYTEEYSTPKVVLGAPTIPKEVMAAHLASIEEDAKHGRPRRVISSATPPERLPLCLSMVQQGLMTKLLGDEKILFPLERLDDILPTGAEAVPPILIIHGRDDSAVPVEGSEKWTAKAREKLGDDKVMLVVQPGEHGFDTAENGVTLDTAWLKEALGPVTAAWLGTTTA